MREGETRWVEREGEWKEVRERGVREREIERKG